MNLVSLYTHDRKKIDNDDYNGDDNDFRMGENSSFVNFRGDDGSRA